MSPKVRAYNASKKTQRQQWESNRPKRKSVSIAEYDMLRLAQERHRMSEEDSNVMFLREEEPDTLEGLRMLCEDLRSRLHASETAKGHLNTTILRLKLRLSLTSASKAKND